MPIEYVVRQGDCISSISVETGFLSNTLWNHPANSGLKQKRKDPNVLFEGDVVVIPDKELKNQSCATDKKHRFVRLGVPEKLQLVLLDDCGVPRAGLPYDIVIDGAHTTGKTDSEGKISVPIPPGAREGRLTITDHEVIEEYPLDLGHLDPIDEISGVQKRLANLGFDCGSDDGVLGPDTVDAIRQFQQQRSLEVTGRLDDATRDTLKEVHGS